MIQKLPPPERAEVEAKIAAVDPLRFAPALRDRALAGKVLMINAAEDEVIPRQCTEKLAEALGHRRSRGLVRGAGALHGDGRVAPGAADDGRLLRPRLARGGTLPTTAGARLPPSQRPVQRLATLLQQAIAMLAAEPDKGRCHFADLELSASDKGGRPIEARVRLVRGEQGKFSLRCQLPEIGEVALGQGRFPWMLAGGKTVLVGSEEPRRQTPIRCASSSRGT